jgi:hypothetical protein
MEQSHSSEASCSASQEITHLLWKPKGSPPQLPVMSQINPIHNLPPTFPNIHFNIILLSMPSSFLVVSSLQAFQPKLCTFFISPIQATCSVHFILPRRYKYSPQHSVLKHLNLHSSLCAKDQVSHPYKTTGCIF